MCAAWLGLKLENSQAKVNQFDSDGLFMVVYQQDVVCFYISVDHTDPVQGIESCRHLQEMKMAIIRMIT